MGAISIGPPRGNNSARVDRIFFYNGQWPVVCFLYHCHGLSPNSPHDCGTICPGCEIRKDRGICVCRGRTLTRALSLAWILQEKKGYMEHMGNYRHLGQTAETANRNRKANGMPPGEQRFRLWPNDAVLSGLYGHPASARRATAQRGRNLSALLAVLLF